MPIQFIISASSLGLVLTARGDKGIVAVLFGDSEGELERDLRQRFPDETITDGASDLRNLGALVIKSIEGPDTDWHLPLDPRGTVFQQKVWKALRRIPAGSTVSYTEMAKRLGMPKGARAIAQACAANPLAVIVPCHRVVRSDGALSGYRWGIERKRALLAREARD